MFPRLVLSEAILFQYLSIMHETSILWLWVVIHCSHFWKEASCLSLCRSKEFWLSLWALVLPYEFGYKLSRNLYNYWKIANERRHLCSTLIQVVSTQWILPNLLFQRNKFNILVNVYLDRVISQRAPWVFGV